MLLMGDRRNRNGESGSQHGILFGPHWSGMGFYHATPTFFSKHQVTSNHQVTTQCTQLIKG